MVVVIWIGCVFGRFRYRYNSRCTQLGGKLPANQILFRAWSRLLTALGVKASGSGCHPGQPHCRGGATAKSFEGMIIGMGLTIGIPNISQ